MLSFVTKYAENTFSQNGEDGLAQEIIRRLGLVSGTCCEFGANDGLLFSNTARLLKQGWTGLMIESDWDLYQKCKQNWADYQNVRVQCSRVDERNINAFVKDNCDLVSMDADGDDFKIFAGMKAHPKIVIVEIDSSYPPDVIAFNKDGAGTYRSTLLLAQNKDYFLVAHTGNMIFLLNQYRNLFPEIIGDGLSNTELYFNRGWL